MPLLYYIRSVKVRNLMLRSDLRYVHVLSDSFGTTDYWFTHMEPSLGGFWVSRSDHRGILISKDAIIQEFATNPAQVPLAS